MKNRIKNHIDRIFASAPDCERTREIKEEMVANVSDRYDDLLNEGRSAEEAYDIAISGIGDISELVREIKKENDEAEKQRLRNPYEQNGEWDGYGEKKDRGQKEGERRYTAAELDEIERYRRRSGIVRSIAVSLYIICWLPLVIMSSVFAPVDDITSETAELVGLGIMMLIIAAATAMLIINSSNKPLCLKGIRDEDDVDFATRKKLKKHPALKIISGILWPVTFLAFFALGFIFGAWHPAWMLFLMATAVENIVESIFELAGKKYV